jgi:type IV pilus assembly protein PilY1
MKAKPATQPRKLGRALIFCAMAALADGPARAANTDISNIPLANASATSALPNIYFLLDDSGSMDWNTLPGATDQNQWVGKGGYWLSSHCNGLAYDPTQTYSAPPALSSTALKRTTVTAACDDGYDTGASCRTNLSNNYYYIYKGTSASTQPDLGFTYVNGKVDTRTTFYRECNSSNDPSHFTSVTVSTLTAAEQQNYANWYSYFRTRINMAKSSIGTAFKDVRGTPLSYAVDPTDADHFHARVGFRAINDRQPRLSLADFNSGQKTAFYDRLYTIKPNGGTPLRPALQDAGEMYRTQGWNAPIQYACQKNFAIVTTDGYWNGNGPNLNPSNQDSSQPRPMYDGASGQGTRTDVWQRYAYSTSSSGCAAPQTKLVTQEQRQTITTKLRNGIPQSRSDSGWSDYGSATSGNCSDSTSVPAPNPSDEMWLSTSDTPSTLSGGSSNSLSDVAMYYYKTDLRPDLANKVPPIKSTGNPDIDDVATWQHMTTYAIGLGVNGTLSFDPNYKNTSDASSDFYKILCPAGTGCSDWPNPSGDDPQAVDDLWHAAVDGRGTYFSAKNPKALAASLKQALSEMNAATGSGSTGSTSNLNPLPGTDFQYEPLYQTGDWTGDLLAKAIMSSGQPSATATWSAAAMLKNSFRATGDASKRVVYTSKPGGRTLMDFKPASFTTASEKAWFDNSQLVQYSEEWNTAQKNAGTLDNLINYLRGDTDYERRASAKQQLYRVRNGAIGDIIGSQPVFVGKPSFNFEDSGYAKFKSDKASRAATIYVGANDGMLHAINAADGSERWAYVPPMALPNLWRLADRDYGGNHRYYVDGQIAVLDASINGAWATVLVGGMGAGGRGYYVLDVTDPATPRLLWTFSADDNANVGYSFGTPLLAKVGGTWAAILASGHNNVPEAGGTKFASADGHGYVFVRRLSDGSNLAAISAGASVGSASTPSGLASLNVHYKSSTDPTALAVYGGDLTGSMYRFDLGAATASTLIALDRTQPITSAPEIASIGGKPVVYFGTGRYLGKSDMVTSDTQAIYAVKDDVDASGGRHTATVSELVRQSLSTAGVVTATAVDWGGKYGWYVELPNSGERVTIAPQLQLGVVAFTTMIPPATAADPCKEGGGTGWLYQFSYINGGSVNGNTTIGTKLGYLPVGMALMGTGNLGGNQPPGKIEVRLADGSDAVVDIMKSNGSATTGKPTRVLWRELLK